MVALWRTGAHSIDELHPSKLAEDIVKVRWYRQRIRFFQQDAKLLDVATVPQDENSKTETHTLPRPAKEW
jgi:hypothetical protein